MTQSDDPVQDAVSRPGRTSVIAGPIVVILGAAAVAAGVWAAPEAARIPVAVTGAVAVLALAALTVTTLRYRDRARGASAGTERAAREAERLLAAADAERQGVLAEYGRRLADAEEAAARHAGAAAQYERRLDAALAAFAAASGRMQAMTTAMLAELREMEHRHADPDVLADLLALDHRTAQAGRLADSIAVLSGARTGRRWPEPIAMESILRGAMGRVGGYQRVRLRAVADIAVAGHAAEGVMHLLAELIDNACSFSPPTTEVHVYAVEVPAGVILTIEDSGLVMSESVLRRAEATVAGAGNAGRPDLSAVSGTRLGLSVVGHLARKHGLQVSYRPSAIGGTAVVVVVPRDLTAEPAVRTTAPRGLAPVPARPPERTPAPQPAPAPTGIAAAPAGIDAAPGDPGPAETTALPRRRRGQTLSAAHPQGVPQGTAPAPSSPPVRPGALGAFQRAFGTDPAPRDVEETE
ncbi:ATP-binding protein [Nocardia thailandica]